jgi:hypothetical protein
VTNRLANPTILVCEEHDRWILAWRRALAVAGDRLRPVRTLSQCAAELAAAPGSLVALEVTDDRAAAALSTLSRWRRRYAAVRVIGMLGPSAGDDPSADELEPLLYEAGAMLVVRSALEVRAAARVARKHLSLAPPARLPLREAILDRLPWAEFATPGFSAAGFASMGFSTPEFVSGGTAAAPTPPPALPAGP